MQDDDAALLQQALALSMAEAAAAAAAAGSTAGDLTMAESGGDDQDLAFGEFRQGILRSATSSGTITSVLIIVFSWVLVSSIDCVIRL